jgi:glutathione peroxidase
MTKLGLILILILPAFIVSFALAKVQVKSKASAPAEISKAVAAPAEKGLYAITVQDAQGHDVKLSEYKNKYLLVVNVASKCGYTKQYEGLQKLYENYQKKDFVVLGFPSNQFLSQEPGTNEEIQKFCKLNYGVTFPVFAKADVNGEAAQPLYKWLTSQEKFSGRITWNFNKFLINKNGEVIKRYSSSDTPQEIDDDIKKLL